MPNREFCTPISHESHRGGACPVAMGTANRSGILGAFQRQARTSNRRRNEPSAARQAKQSWNTADRCWFMALARKNLSSLLITMAPRYDGTLLEVRLMCGHRKRELTIVPVLFRHSEVPTARPDQLGRSKWLWDRAFSYLLMDTR
jgi:hypothetical protein